MDEFKKQVAQEMGGDWTSGYVDGHMIKHRASERTKLFARKSRISTGYSTEIRYIFKLVH